MSAAKLTLADQALANLLGFLAVQTVEDTRTDFALSEVARLLPAVTRAIGPVAALAGAGLELVACAPRRRDPRHASAWAAAHLTARAAVAEFLIWRAGLALDALSRALESKGDAA